MRLFREAKVVEGRDFPAPALNLEGKEQAEGQIFFSAAPQEIGEVQFGGTSLSVGKRVLSVELRVAIWSAAALAISGMWLLALTQNGDMEGILAWGFVALFGSVSLALVLWKIMEYREWCGYVGRDGVAKFTITGSIHGKVKVKMILFKDAADMRTMQSQNEIHGMYTHTLYEYSWRDSNRRVLLRLTGRYHSEAGAPQPGNPFYLARAAEAAWGQHILERAEEMLGEHGYLRFEIDRARGVTLGPGYIEVRLERRVDRCEVGDIVAITAGNGMVMIQRRKEKWYSTNGPHKFSLATMPNARLFMLAVARFLPESSWAKRGGEGGA